MKTNIIAVKYEDNQNPKTFNGKKYSYYTDIDLKVGDIVEAPTKYGKSYARVSEINIPEEKIQDIKPYMKSITRKLNRDLFFYDLYITEEAA